jgi:hypothetical protein
MPLEECARAVDILRARQGLKILLYPGAGSPQKG